MKYRFIVYFTGSVIQEIEADNIDDVVKNADYLMSKIPDSVVAENMLIEDWDVEECE